MLLMFTLGFFYLQGGNPLDFKSGNAASVSVQSTSLTDHHAEHFITRYIFFLLLCFTRL